MEELLSEEAGVQLYELNPGLAMICKSEFAQTPVMPEGDNASVSKSLNWMSILSRKRFEKMQPLETYIFKFSIPSAALSTIVEMGTITRESLAGITAMEGISCTSVPLMPDPPNTRFTCWGN